MQHFFLNRSYFGEKASGTSAITAVIYAGTAQSLNGLARELIARGTLYQSCHSLRVVTGLQRLDSFPENTWRVVSLLVDHFCQSYLHMHTFLLVQQNRH